MGMTEAIRGVREAYTGTVFVGRTGWVSDLQHAIVAAEAEAEKQDADLYAAQEDVRRLNSEAWRRDYDYQRAREAWEDFRKGNVLRGDDLDAYFKEGE